MFKTKICMTLIFLMIGCSLRTTPQHSNTSVREPAEKGTSVIGGDRKQTIPSGAASWSGKGTRSEDFACELYISQGTGRKRNVVIGGDRKQIIPSGAASWSRKGTRSEDFACELYISQGTGRKRNIVIGGDRKQTIPSGAASCHRKGPSTEDPARDRGEK